MRDIEFNNKPEIELSVKKQKQAEHALTGNIIPHENHVIWQINTQTLEIEKAKYSNATYHIGGENKKEIIKKDGFAYVAALNKKNALRKYKKGLDGSKTLGNEKLNFF